MNEASLNSVYSDECEIHWLGTKASSLLKYLSNRINHMHIMWKSENYVNPLELALYYREWIWMLYNLLVVRNLINRLCLSTWITSQIRRPYDNRQPLKNTVNLCFTAPQCCNRRVSLSSPFNYWHEKVKMQKSECNIFPLAFLYEMALSCLTTIT